MAAGAKTLAFQSSTDSETAAALAALLDADAASREIEARCSVTKALLQAIQERHAAQVEGRSMIEENSVVLHTKVDDVDHRTTVLTEAEAASSKRLMLTRQLLVESGKRLEGLRVRGAVAEECLRERTITLGGMSERLLERKQQLRALTRRTLEQRLRVGLQAWLPSYRLEETLDRWRQTLVRRAENVERLRGVAVLWRLSALNQAVRTWQSTATSQVRKERSGHAEAAAQRRRAMQGLDRAVELRSGAALARPAAALGPTPVPVR